MGQRGEHLGGARTPPERGSAKGSVCLAAAVVKLAAANCQFTRNAGRTRRPKLRGSPRPVAAAAGVVKRCQGAVYFPGSGRRRAPWPWPKNARRGAGVVERDGL